MNNEQHVPVEVLNTLIRLTNAWLTLKGITAESETFQTEGEETLATMINVYLSEAAKVQTIEKAVNEVYDEKK